MKRIFLCDEQPIVLEGLRALLSTLPETTLAGCATTIEGLDECLLQARTDLLILDSGLLPKDGARTDYLKRGIAPGVQVILFSRILSEEGVHDALRSGVAGLLRKWATNEELKAAILRVISGERSIDPEALEYFTRRMRRSPLSTTERDLLKMLGAGIDTEALSKQLGVSESAARARMHTVLVKLEVKDRLGAVLSARERGLI